MLSFTQITVRPNHIKAGGNDYSDWDQDVEWQGDGIDLVEQLIAEEEEAQAWIN